MQVRVYSLIFLILAAISGLYGAMDDPLTSDRTRWFRDAKFGMFIHWGIYSVPAQGEWIMNQKKIPVLEYEKFALQFNPVKFNAKEWVKAAKNAGMKYIVITSKHHDGFCMFDTKFTDYNIVRATPYKKDVMKDLAEACRKEGIKFCFYYSIMDWHHPDANKNNWDKYIEYMKGQLNELLSNYGPLGILWFDGDWISEWDSSQGKELELYMQNKQPNLMVNNRIGKRTSEDGDFNTPEQEIPGAGVKNRLWETCMTINYSWGYNSSDNNWKSSKTLIQNLINVVSKGGNFLLNVGPDSGGIIPQPSLQRLAEIGKWINLYQSAIYGAEKSPFKFYDFDGRCAVKGKTLYVFIFNWPENGIRLRAKKWEIEKYRTVNPEIKLAGYEIKEEKEEQLLILKKPETTDPSVSVVALELKNIPETSLYMRPSFMGTFRLEAAYSEIIGKTIRIEGNNIGWWMDKDEYALWNIDVLEEGNYDVELTYSCDKATAGSEFYNGISGGNSVSGKIDSTETWWKYKRMDLGKLFLEKGKHTIEVRALKKPGYAVMNLGQIKLTKKNTVDLILVKNFNEKKAIILKAEEAKIHGDSARYEKNDVKDNIGYWNNLEDYVSWDVAVPKEEKYAVLVEFACPADCEGSEFAVGIKGEDPVLGTVVETGSWDNYEEVYLGILALSKGRQVLEVRPVSKPGGAVMNLKQIKLIPIK